MIVAIKRSANACETLAAKRGEDQRASFQGGFVVQRKSKHVRVATLAESVVVLGATAPS